MKDARRGGKERGWKDDRGVEKDRSRRKEDRKIENKSKKREEKQRRV